MASSKNDSETIRRSILLETIRLTRQNSDLPEEELVQQATQNLAPLFEQLATSGNAEKAKPKARPKRKMRYERKDHVGRFFLRLMEKKLRQSKIPQCLIPVFAQSVEVLLGEQDYNRFAEKINRLLDFGTKKGYNYDQILDSKPGKEIAREIISLYKGEAKSGWFENKIKNQLDETLVNHLRQNPGEDINIENAIHEAYRDFIQALDEIEAPSSK